MYNDLQYAFENAMDSIHLAYTPHSDQYFKDVKREDFEKFFSTLSSYYYHYYLLGDIPDDVFEQYLIDNNLTEDDIEESSNNSKCGKDLHEAINSIYSNYYGYLLYCYSQIGDNKVKEIYKEEILDAWKEAKLPV